MTRVILVVFLLVSVCAIPSFAALTDEQKDELLKAHNHYRSRVSPTATNMAALVWDEQLSYLSQYWAVRCEYILNENRHEQDSNYDYVGENIAGSANYTTNLTAMVFNWYFEGRLYDYSTAACTDDDGNEEEEGCESYTQLVWANTRRVGCGAYLCEELMDWEDDNDNGDDDDEKSVLYVVCDYGPGGSFAGIKPYETGNTPCTGCPSDLPDCENKLCVGGAPPAVAKISMVTVALLLAMVAFIF